MYQEWTNIDVTFLTKIGIVPRGRSLRACRIYCKRNGYKFPGKKFLKDNEEILKLYESRYDNKQKVTQMKGSSNLKEIEVTKIRENPNNPRTRIESVEDLKASIKASGLLCPIAVRWKDGYYEVVAGSRRYRACREIGLKTIPCNVLPQIGDDMAYELATAENIVRENMSAVDEANAVAKLFDHGKSRTEIGAMFGKSARWAEGRRKIVELGDKAMEYLAAGKINLGHAEVLTMCNPEDVNRWLDKAAWSTPEALKTQIMNEKPLLERAPFDAKKVCKHCEKRSDEQKDLFGDVQCCYCLDWECFAAKVKMKAERIRKQYIKDGFEEVPKDKFYDATHGWSGWYDADTEDDVEKECIEELMKKGEKQMFWVNNSTAEHGFVWCDREIAFKDESDNDEDSDDSNIDKDSFEYKMSRLSYDDRNKVKKAASVEERNAIRNKVKDALARTDKVAQSLILSLIDVEFNTSENESESYLLHIGESDDENKYFADKFIDEVCEHIVGDWSGCNDAERKFFDIADRETFEREAYEALEDQFENKEEKEED